MQYKILSASFGYNGKVYMQGEFITLKSEKEAEELISFGCIITAPIVKAKLVEIEVPKEEEKVKAETPKEEAKSVSIGRVGNHVGGRKRK